MAGHVEAGLAESARRVPPRAPAAAPPRAAHAGLYQPVCVLDRCAFVAGSLRQWLTLRSL